MSSLSLDHMLHEDRDHVCLTKYISHCSAWAGHTVGMQRPKAFNKFLLPWLPL